MTFKPDLCATCGHTTGDHKSRGNRWPHPTRFGACLVRDCECREFRGDEMMPEHSEQQHGLRPSTGRKKLSGQAALTMRGDGWGREGIVGPWTYVGIGPNNGPDVVLTADVEAGAMWDHVTRALNPEGEDER